MKTTFIPSSFKDKYNDALDTLVRDLIRKACDDAFKAVDRTMQLAGTEKDIEVEGFIKTSILASVATNFTGAFIDFLYSTNEQPGKDVVMLPEKEFNEFLASVLAQIGGVIIKGHIQRRADRTKR